MHRPLFDGLTYLGMSISVIGIAVKAVSVFKWMLLEFDAGNYLILFVLQKSIPELDTEYFWNIQY